MRYNRYGEPLYPLEDPANQTSTYVDPTQEHHTPAPLASDISEEPYLSPLASDFLVKTDNVQYTKTGLKTFKTYAC